MRRNQSAGLDRRFQGPPSAVRHLPYLPNGTLTMQERRARSSSKGLCWPCASSVSFEPANSARPPHLSCHAFPDDGKHKASASSTWASFAKFASVPRPTAPLHSSDLDGASQHRLRSRASATSLTLPAPLTSSSLHSQPAERWVFIAWVNHNVFARTARKNRHRRDANNTVSASKHYCRRQVPVSEA